MSLAAAAAQIPENLQAPSSEVVLLKALGKGKQIYACKAKAGAEGQFEWVLDRPDATLSSEDGARIGKHYKGPAWEATDGSKVTGQVVQRMGAPAANAVPWLLLKAASHDGAGTFARVSYIQRVDTQGGVAPAEGCDKSHVAAEVSVDYQANYIFYVPK
jgi:hypothetical protein